MTAAAESLNARRDAYVSAIRALLARFPEALPADQKGILGRAGDVLSTQEPVLERLDDLDLEGSPTREEAREVAEVLLRAQHLPRMILAFGQVLLQEEKSRALRPVEQEALLLARDLAFFTQEWAERHQDLLDLVDPDDDPDGTDDPLAF